MKKPLIIKVNMKWGCAGLLNLPVGEFLVFFTLRGWEHVSSERTLAVYQSASLLTRPFFLSWNMSIDCVCRETVWRVETTYVHVLSHTTSQIMAVNASEVFAKTWLASLPSQSVPTTLLKKAQFCRAWPALALRSLFLTDLIIEVTRRSGCFLCTDGRTPFCSSHGYPQEAVWKGRTVAPALTFLNCLHSVQTDARWLNIMPWLVMTYLQNGDVKLPPVFFMVIRLLTSYDVWQNFAVSEPKICLRQYIHFSISAEKNIKYLWDLRDSWLNRFSSETVIHYNANQWSLKANLSCCTWQVKGIPLLT